MLDLAYDEAPYLVLFYDDELHAYRTDRFEGWSAGPGDGRVNFFTFGVAAYLDLVPVGFTPTPSPATPTPDAPSVPPPTPVPTAAPTPSPERARWRPIRAHDAGAGRAARRRRRRDRRARHGQAPTRAAAMTGPDGSVAPALDPSAIAELLAATAATVAEELRALGADAGWRPAAGEWSANECVGHLIEAERRGFAGRIRTILAAPVEGASHDAGGRGIRRRSRRPGAITSDRQRSSSTSSSRCGPTASSWSAALRPRTTSSGRGGTRRSASCGSTSCSASGSTTTATTSARCWPSPSRGCGTRWATRSGSASRRQSSPLRTWLSEARG